ncbi:uncharacterized protein lekr1 [Siphateles boraxobius]|uniref:uncharacterized protein lekr1 n=1 Tax=Siphateles boraxobius TaxID=180520 RepID=UPI0040628EAD
MEKIPRESADKEEMEIQTPSYPLPLEIQQMDQSEKACRYCGVSYLILHEFQRLQERLWDVERELELERGGVERERSLREELQAAYTRLEDLKTSLLQQEEATRALDLQLCVVMRETEKELENERSCRLNLRSRFIQQQRRLREALVLLQSSRGEMTTVKSLLTHFLETWDNSKARIHQSCISADAECVRLNQEVELLQAELMEVHVELSGLSLNLDTARAQMQNQVQSHKLLQNQNQEAQSLIQGLKEEVKTLKIDLQNSMHEKEHGKKLLEIKSVEKEDLQVLWSEQTTTIERLSRDLREEEESRLSCQRRCESMQEQLLAWQQKEEEVTRRLERAEDEMKDLRVAQSTLQQERDELRRSHVGELERLEESFRIRLKAAEEHRSKMEALLQQKQAEQDKQLKQQKMEIRRDAEIELDIQRQKNQELQNKYQSENQQLQNKIPALVRSATQELQEELAALQKRVHEQEEQIRESATQRQQEILQEQRTGETQMQELRQNTHQLNIAQSHIQKLREERDALEEERSLLEETVRRECEEREELTAALTLAKEQLQELRHATLKPHNSQTHTRLSRSTAMNPDLPVSRVNPSPSPPHTHIHSTSSSVGRSTASWHGSSRPIPTLPKISKERLASVNGLCKSLGRMRSRQDKL